MAGRCSSFAKMPGACVWLGLGVEGVCLGVLGGLRGLCFSGEGIRRGAEGSAAFLLNLPLPIRATPIDIFCCCFGLNCSLVGGGWVRCYLFC